VQPPPAPGPEQQRGRSEEPTGSGLRHEPTLPARRRGPRPGDPTEREQQQTSAAPNGGDAPQADRKELRPPSAGAKRRADRQTDSRGKENAAPVRESGRRRTISAKLADFVIEAQPPARGVRDSTAAIS
jgi:hypothetical protein